VRLSLRLKFILLISAILLVIFALISVFLVRNVRTSLTSNINQESTAFASLATKSIGDTFNLYRQSGTVRIQQEVERFTDLDKNITNVAVVDVSGQELFVLRPKSKISVSAADSFDPVYSLNPSGQIISLVQPYFDDNGLHSYAVVYQVSTEGVEQAIRRQELDILIFAILGLIISAMATYEFINIFFLRPIEQVSRMSGVIASGYYGQQIALKRNDEIGHLALSVNRMAETLKTDIAKLQELDEVKTEFIRITSHNLRTPLTIIEGNVSMLQEAKLKSELKQMVDAIGAGTRRLYLFTEQMLAIADIEAGTKVQLTDTVTLEQLTETLVQEFQQIASDKKVQFKTEFIDAQASVKANRYLLAGALRNLLDNAFKFTEKGTVTLRTSVDHDQAVITVSDTGIGIAPDEQPKLFTKFHRATDIMRYQYEGTGIGLYVVKLIVTQHGGVVTAESELGKGTTFTIKLPLGQPQPAPVQVRPAVTSQPIEKPA
jgi:signal transduction histidine kinase